MGKPTGQMQQETQETLDEYNELYNWEYNEMCEFIENYGETEFLTYYETYHRLCEDYDQKLVDEFAEHYETYNRLVEDYGKTNRTNARSNTEVS